MPLPRPWLPAPDSLLCVCSQVIAEDADGPSFNQVRYTIVEGNQGTPFTIDPLRGEVKVARQLDREKVGAVLYVIVLIILAVHVWFEIVWISMVIHKSNGSGRVCVSACVRTWSLIALCRLQSKWSQT